MKQTTPRGIVAALSSALALTFAGCSGGANPAVSRAASGPGAGSSSLVRAPLAVAIHQLGGCNVFPANNPWNRDISRAKVDPNSANYLAHMNAATTNLHPDFGSNPAYGIPVTIAPASQPFVPMTFFNYPTESDPGPYPFPPNAAIEGGNNSTGDRHVLVVSQNNCKLYETAESYYVGPGWNVGNGAVFDLSSNALRPICWTSADAAGLPIAPALPEYDEVTAGAINHALRFTMQRTQRAFVYPARHFASSSTDPSDPPMGLRVRLKANYDLSHVTGQSLVVLTALKKYGMLLADNGSDWFVTGSTDTRWNDNDLDQIKSVPASAFEVVLHDPLHTNC